jgi:hypothetical protein
MKWYIGQPIVAIRNQKQNVFKKGQEFKIKALRQSDCCSHILIHIGIDASNVFSKMCCSICGRLRDTDSFYSERNFAPLDQDISELTEILTKKETA